MYTQHLLNSGYNRTQIREIIISAIRGYERKEKDRVAQNKPKFRHGKDTLSSRIKKKLTENTTWFKNNKDREKPDRTDIGQ